MNKPIRTSRSSACCCSWRCCSTRPTCSTSTPSALNDRVDNGGCATRSSPASAARSWPAGTSVAESVKSNDQYKFQRIYPQPFKYAPLTGFYLRLRPRPASSAPRTTSSPAATTALFVNRLVDLVRQRHQGRQRRCSPSTPRRRRRRSTGSARSGPTCRAPSWRSSRRTGKILAMVSLPTYDPNRLASHDFSEVQDAYATQLRTLTRPSRCSTGRSRPRLPPGSTFKLVTAAAARPDRAGTTPTRWCRRVRRYTLPQTHRRGAQRERQRLRQPQDHADPGPGGLLQHLVRAARGRRSARRDAPARPRSSASTRATSTTCPPRRPRRFPAGLDEPQTGAVRRSASSTSRPRRCRWRWSPPGSPTAAW